MINCVNQTTMDFGFGRYPNRPGWKVPGPSAEAAEETKSVAGRLRALCLKALREHGPMTADEVAQVLGESILSVRPRISELRLLGKISDSGRRHENQSGKRATVWQINI